ncbi:ATP-binding protein [Streptomyces sp. NPDC002784]
MTTPLTDPERALRRVPGAADEPRRHRGVYQGLAMSIERQPAPDGEGLSSADAAWPQRLRRIVRASLTYWGCPHLVETAELLLTELSTNALRHAFGLDIGVRMCLQDGHLMIEVYDGSPLRPVARCADPYDESGRGLLLLDSLAEEWGVSEDGTTTWCTLPLTKGSSPMEPVAVTAPVMRTAPIVISGDRNAGALARRQARTLLTMLRWPGDHHRATDVLHVLVDNAVQHALTAETGGQRLEACLSVTEAHELLIDVTDSDPAFPEFDKAIAGVGGSLWEIAQHGVALTWFVGATFDGKTVRAVLRPGPVDW